MRLCRLLLFAIAVFICSSAFGIAGQGDPLPRKAFLGVAVAPVTAEKQKQLGLRVDEGLEVTRVVAGGTAEKLGVTVGDVLVVVGKVRVGVKAPLPPVAAKLYANKPIDLTILRGGKRQTLSGVLVGRPYQTSNDFVVEYSQVLSQGKRIRLIATHPKGPGRYPTIFLIGGIGAYSVDGSFEAIPYGNVMGPLAKAGFATVRIDKPGQGDSEGPVYTDLRFGVELDAYRQALKYAKTLPFVDSKRIGIFGQSMGGTFGPLIAAEEPVAALAVHGTISKTWMEYWIENVRRQSAMAGAAASALDLSQKQLVAMNTYLFYEKLSPAEVARRHPELKAAVGEQSPDGKTISGVGIPFFQELADQNLPKAWEALNSQVLVLWGENDFISTRFDHEYIADIVNQKHPGSATFRMLENSDHGFFQTSSQKDSMDKWGRGGAHNPNVEEALIAWFTKVLAAK